MATPVDEKGQTPAVPNRSLQGSDPVRRCAASKGLTLRRYGHAGYVLGVWNASLRYWFNGTVSSFVLNHFA